MPAFLGGKGTWEIALSLSAMGQKRTSKLASVMSAFGRKADSERKLDLVCYRFAA